jgi:hypothetical protein
MAWCGSQRLHVYPLRLDFLQAASAKRLGERHDRSLLGRCEKAGMRGVAVMVRDGPWLADRRLFLANGFEPVDTAPPDYQLLVRKFDSGAVNPAFQERLGSETRQYGRGLTIIRSSQCPHIAKFAAEIAETAENEYHIRPTVVDLESWSDAQNAPTPYAIFALIYNGRLLADHQISRTRFRNIMSKCVTPVYIKQFVALIDAAGGIGTK